MFPLVEGVDARLSKPCTISLTVLIGGSFGGADIEVDGDGELVSIVELPCDEKLLFGEGGSLDDDEVLDILVSLDDDEVFDILVSLDDEDVGLACGDVLTPTGIVIGASVLIPVAVLSGGASVLIPVCILFGGDGAC